MFTSIQQSIPSIHSQTRVTRLLTLGNPSLDAFLNIFYQNFERNLCILSTDLLGLLGQGRWEQERRGEMVGLSPCEFGVEDQHFQENAGLS